MKKLNKFRKYLLIYTGVLLVLGISFSLYVVSSLKLYEKNQVSTYIKHELKNNKTIDLASFNISQYEKSKDVSSALSYLVDNTELTIKEKESGNFTVSSDGIEIVDIVIEEGKEVTRLGILTFNVLSTKEISFINENGLYAYEVRVPSDFVVEVNGKAVDQETESKQENLDGYNGVESVNAPTVSVYDLDGFINKPDIVIKNNDGEVIEPDVNGKVISSSNYKATDSNEEAMGMLVEPIDVMSLAKDYSLFMTNDLGGNMRGFSKLEKYFIKGSDMYNLARSWATGVDITFVSVHTFKNPMFSNTSLSDFKIYNDKAFSVLVHLDKNMIVKKKDRIDTMNDEWFFVYENGWKLVDMKYINEGN